MTTGVSLSGVRLASIQPTRDRRRRIRGVKMRLSLAASVLLAVSVVSLPAAAQMKVLLSQLAGSAGEGVDVRLPGFSVPPGLNNEYAVDFLPKVTLDLALDDGAGNPVATIEGLEYPHNGLTLRFSTGDVSDGSAELLLDGQPTGGQLPVRANGRVEYSAELLIFVRPTLVVEGATDGSPGEHVGFTTNAVHVVAYSLVTGLTVAAARPPRFKPGKELSDALN